MDNSITELPIQKELSLEAISRQYSALVDKNPEEAKAKFKEIIILYERRLQLLTALRFN